jgi:hypothetical protein
MVGGSQHARIVLKILGYPLATCGIPSDFIRYFPVSNGFSSFIVCKAKR